VNVPPIDELEKISERDDLSVAEVASRYGVSRGAVYKALQRRNGKYTRVRALAPPGMNRHGRFIAAQLAEIRFAILFHKVGDGLCPLRHGSPISALLQHRPESFFGPSSTRPFGSPENSLSTAD
jgi:hypothetical protein